MSLFEKLKVKIVYILSTLLMTTFSISVAQVDSDKVKQESKSIFNNQGDQENHWAKKLFRNNYIKQEYNLFEGQLIIINENTFKFDEKILEVYNTSNELKSIFIKGIFYPNIITGNFIAEIKTKQELISMTSEQIMLYNFSRIDSLIITDFEELEFLSNSSKYKRFRFLLFRKGMSNPTVYFIELTNESATKKTSITEFIIKSKLTFFERGWMQI